MDRVLVISSDLAEVGYDPATFRLEVMFKGGSVYEYENLPGQVYRGLMEASSKGSYFHRFIRNQYPTRRLR